MRFSEAFTLFAAQCGLNVSQETSEENTLLFDDLHAVTFQCDKDDQSVILSAEICDLNSLAQNGLETLLDVSLFGAQTGGAAFAISRQLGTVILWKRYDDNFADEHALEQAVNSFLAAVITWKGKLASGPLEGSGTQNSYVGQLFA